MTKNRDFKAVVRQRMAKTGERYSTARGHVLAGTAPAESRVPGLLPGIVAVGGSQADIAAARNLCVNAGLTGPDGRPPSEALAFGLAGGVGFLYGVFEYGDVPTMTIVARNQSMPDPFCQAMFDRIGVATTVSETTGAKKAATALDDALSAGRPALCTVGAGGLPHLGTAQDVSAMAPHIVGVIGIDGEQLWLDDRSPEPIAIDRGAFDEARAAYRAGKHRMVVIDTVPDELDWPTVLKAAVTGAVDGYDRPPVPQFKSNVGRAGLAKWAELLTSGGKKGWRSVFGSGRRAAIGLTRVYDCINNTYTSPAAGRPLFADFLDEAADVADQPAWRAAAEQWRAAGQRWDELSALAIGAHEDIGHYAELAEERAGLLDGASDDSPVETAAAMRAMYDEQQAIIEGCDLSADAAAAVYDAMAPVVSAIADVETEALAALS